MVSLYTSICESVARQGFTKICILIGHGSSETTAYFFQDLIFDRKQKSGVPKYDYSVYVFYVIQSLIYQSEQNLSARELALTKGLSMVWDSPPEKMGHGSESETSLVMAIRPDLVKLDRLEPLPEGEGISFPKPSGSARYPVEFKDIAPKGYRGWPHHATVEKGEKVLNLIADFWAGTVKEIKSHDPKMQL